MLLRYYIHFFIHRVCWRFLHKLIIVQSLESLFILYVDEERLLSGLDKTYKYSIY